MADQTETPNNDQPDSAPAPSADEGAEAALKAAQEAVASLREETEAAVTTTEAGVAQEEGPAQPDQSESVAPETMDYPQFRPAETAPTQCGIELLSNVNLKVRVELGRTMMLMEDVLRLNEGSVVELDKLAGDPVDVFVNDRHVATGEVLVLNDSFCVRINEILHEPVDQQDRQETSGANGVPAESAAPTASATASVVAPRADAGEG